MWSRGHFLIAYKPIFFYSLFFKCTRAPMVVCHCFVMSLFSKKLNFSFCIHYVSTNPRSAMLKTVKNAFFRGPKSEYSKRSFIGHIQKYGCPLCTVYVTHNYFWFITRNNFFLTSFLLLSLYYYNLFLKWSSLLLLLSLPWSLPPLLKPPSMLVLLSPILLLV